MAVGSIQIVSFQFFIKKIYAMENLKESSNTSVVHLPSCKGKEIKRDTKMLAQGRLDEAIECILEENK